MQRADATVHTGRGYTQPVVELDDGLCIALRTGLKNRHRVYTFDDESNMYFVLAVNHDHHAVGIEVLSVDGPDVYTKSKILDEHRLDAFMKAYDIESLHNYDELIEAFEDRYYYTEGLLPKEKEDIWHNDT
ncbi:MAG: hypothetical protein ABEN55_21020 [Bradymonadaceae bacterium]